jgi:hypothetical protein
MLSTKSVGGASSLLIGKRGIDMAALIPDLDPEQSIDFYTDGHWSLHELIAYLVDRIGPCEAWLTSWGVTRDPLKSVLDLVRSGTVTHITLILNHRVRLQSPDGYQLLLAVSDDSRFSLCLSKIHAKVLVLRGSRGMVRVITSANLTKNPRIEVYNISTHPRQVIEALEMLSLIKQGADPFRDA